MQIVAMGCFVCELTYGPFVIGLTGLVAFPPANLLATWVSAALAEVAGGLPMAFVAAY